MLKRDEVISSQMMGSAQHRFGERYIVVIPGFHGHLFASRGDIELSIDVDMPTVIREEPAQKPQLVGNVFLHVRSVERSSECFVNQLATPFGVQQGEG